MAVQVEKKKILFVVNADWVALDNYIHILRCVKKEGFEVVVACVDTGRFKELRMEGFQVLNIKLNRAIGNIFLEASSIFSLYKIYKRERPDIIFNGTIKPAIYGAIINRFIGEFKIINSIPGLGYVFVNKKRWFLKKSLFFLAKFGLNYKKSITCFENKLDKDLFVKNAGVSNKRVRVCKISSVDVDKFKFEKESKGIPIVVLPARMIYDKGIREFVGSAKILREKGVNARFILVGKMDPNHPGAIPKNVLNSWESKGFVEYIGFKENMKEIYSKSKIIVLPSYREGVGRVLLEAASSGRAIIATDVPGCREIIKNGETGLLVPVRDTKNLALAIEKLLKSDNLRMRLRREGRKLAIKEFSEEKIIGNIIKLINNVLEIK